MKARSSSVSGSRSGPNRCWRGVRNNAPAPPALTREDGLHESLGHVLNSLIVLTNSSGVTTRSSFSVCRMTVICDGCQSPGRRGGGAIIYPGNGLALKRHDDITLSQSGTGCGTPARYLQPKPVFHPQPVKPNDSPAMAHSGRQPDPIAADAASLISHAATNSAVLLAMQSNPWAGRMMPYSRQLFHRGN